MSAAQRHGRVSSRARVRVQKDATERYLLTYSDLITLLLAFFIVMYGISSADAQKFATLSASMRKAFNVGVLEGSPSSSVLEQMAEVSVTEAGSEEQAGSGSRELDAVFSEMGWVFQEEGLADKVSVTVRPEGVAIGLSGNLLFTSGRAELRPESVKLLSSIAKVLTKLDNPVRVEGHTDDVPPSGMDFSTNWELSGARAVAVVRYFAEIERINPARLSAVAYSQYRPAVINDSPQGRARNRRSEILIMYPPSAMGAPSTPVATPTARMEGAVEEERNSAIATTTR